MFSKKAKKIEDIFTVYLTLCIKCQIDGEDLVNFCGLFRKLELYLMENAIKLGVLVSSFVQLSLGLNSPPESCAS